MSSPCRTCLSLDSFQCIEVLGLDERFHLREGGDPPTVGFCELLLPERNLPFSSYLVIT